MLRTKAATGLWLLTLLLFFGITPSPGRTAANCSEAHIPTSDGLQLEADWCPGPSPEAPLLVLLHMIPPHNSRKNFPNWVIEDWLSKGFRILNLDRRGAGDSSGKAKDAYVGPKGKLDLQAVHRWLSTQNAAPAEGLWACIGASNGTTTCLDYAQDAKTTQAHPGPGALVFLTGGSYTENNTPFANSLAASIPSLFVYNSSERAWPEDQKGRAGEGSQWLELKPGGHGTLAFVHHRELPAQIASFLKPILEVPKVSKGERERD